MELFNLYNKGDEVYILNLMSFTPVRGIIDSELKRIDNKYQFFYMVKIYEEESTKSVEDLPVEIGSIYKNKREAIDILNKLKSGSTSTYSLSSATRGTWMK